MTFHDAHAEIIRLHLSRRSGERKRRLEQRHQHAGSLFLRHVWYPLQGYFDHFNPEYEVLDWRG